MGNNKKAVIIIPARYGSTRLPGKPLLKETGQYLIQHVYNSAKKSKLADKVIVATDDERIYNAVKSFEGLVEMTSSSHKSGTDRIAEVAKKIDADFIINVQGDEPEIPGEAIDKVIELLENTPDAVVSTLVSYITYEEALNPNIVKVVCDKNNYALYFSRSLIPYVRDKETFNKKEIKFLGHIGIYGYKKDFLVNNYIKFPISYLENLEKLEQLRVLENGYKIITALTSYKPHGIDTIEDYKMFLERYKRKISNLNS